MPGSVDNEQPEDEVAEEELWQHAWKTWLAMATHAAKRTPLPKRNFLAALVESFSPLFLCVRISEEERAGGGEKKKKKGEEEKRIDSRHYFFNTGPQASSREAFFDSGCS